MHPSIEVEETHSQDFKSPEGEDEATTLVFSIEQVEK